MRISYFGIQIIFILHINLDYLCWSKISLEHQKGLVRWRMINTQMSCGYRKHKPSLIHWIENLNCSTFLNSKTEQLSVYIWDKLNLNHFHCESSSFVQIVANKASRLFILYVTQRRSHDYFLGGQVDGVKILVGSQKEFLW